jgi:hypothetical protein
MLGFPGRGVAMAKESLCRGLKPAIIAKIVDSEVQSQHKIPLLTISKYVPTSIYIRVKRLGRKRRCGAEVASADSSALDEINELSVSAFRFGPCATPF